MNQKPQILIVSSSHNPDSKSERLARLCEKEIPDRFDATFIELKDYNLTGYDLIEPLKSSSYLKLHDLVTNSDGILMASPVYNWTCCAELKRFVELVGSTPPDRSIQSAFFDKVITFVNAGGGNFSYTAFTELASSMMLDFKCIVSPYNVYAEEKDWTENTASERIRARIKKSTSVFLELVTLLQNRTYSSHWEI